MTRSIIDRTLTSDWDHPGGESTLEALQVGASIGAFRIDEMLGHGGMGVVYQATHLTTGAEVALKTLHRVHPKAVERLKTEFRHLAEVRHKHLVQLFELHTVSGQCFLTMERIHGLNLGDCLTQKGSLSDGAFYERIRRAFMQIAEGLQALHERGLLHLDLKPDNVIVDTAGCVRILDFGLVRSLQSPSPIHANVAGTPRYMAPERTLEHLESTAADWYSFGVMLAEFLQPQWPGPPALLEFSPQVPQDLADLCTRLLTRSPSARPRGAEVVATLSPVESGTFAVAPSVVQPLATIHKPELVGRDPELSLLEEDLRDVKCGHTRWVHLVGESGVGKTSLARCFRQGHLADDSIIVLEGACHERESTPFQGLDGIMEGLARSLAHRAASLSEQEMRWVRSAESLCPALSDILNKETGPPSAQQQDPIERRRAAFLAVKNLIHSLCRDKTVALMLDDVQWGDADGARLLAEFLAHPTTDRLLIITTSRTTKNAAPSFLREIEGLLTIRGTDAVRREIAEERLSDSQISSCLPSSVEDLPESRRQAIVRAADGLPFLAEALGSHPWGPDEEPSLKSLIDLRLRDAPHGAREVLQALALSPSPLPQAVALHFVGRAAQRGAVLAALRHAGLVRTQGESPDGPLEPYHALVAAAVQDEIPQEERLFIRYSLARSLETKQLAGAEQLANLYHLAHRNADAGRFAPQAAREAEAALAFESAASWYARAAEWIPECAGIYLPEHARCLEYAGRTAAAAEAYEQAAELAQAARSSHIRAAGAAWLSCGHVDRGLAALVPELKNLGVSVPHSEKGALLKCLYLLGRIWKRGTHFDSRSATDCKGSELERVDAIWGAAKGLGVVMPMRGLMLQLTCLLAALELREPERVARSLAVLGPMLMGSPLEATGRSWMQQASQLAEGLRSDYLTGILLTFDAVGMCARWESPLRIMSCVESAQSHLKRGAAPSSWERAMALAAELRAREQLGQFAVLSTMGSEWLAEATDRGDLFAQTMANHVLALVGLSAGDVISARICTARSVEGLSNAAYTVQHYCALRYAVQCDLLEGNPEAASTRLNAAWKDLKSAQLLRNPISRPEILLLKGLVELAAASHSGASSCAVAKKMAHLLRRERNPVSQVHAMLLEAGASSLGDARLQTFPTTLEIAQKYRALGLVLQAMCVEKALADSLEDAEANARATEALRASGVRDPNRYAYIHAPKFRSHRPLSRN